MQKRIFPLFENVIFDMHYLLVNTIGVDTISLEILGDLRIFHINIFIVYFSKITTNHYFIRIKNVSTVQLVIDKYTAFPSVCIINVIL